MDNSFFLGTPAALFIDKTVGKNSKMLSFFVPGIPVPQARMKAARVNGHVRMYEPKKSREWKQRIEVATAAAMKKENLKPVTEGPVAAQVVVYIPRPKSHFTSKGNLTKSAPEHHLGRKDLDNFLKLALDGAAPYHPDDKLVTAISAEKHWARETPGSGVFIRLISGDAASG